MDLLSLRMTSQYKFYIVLYSVEEVDENLDFVCDTKIFFYSIGIT